MSLTYTPTEEIDLKIKLARDFYHWKQNLIANERNAFKLDMQDRLLCLKKFYYSIKDHEEEILDAMYKDFHRSKQESSSLDVVPLLNGVLHIIQSLPKWMKSEKKNDWSTLGMFSSVKIEKIPFGTVLVIAPFNFPLLLALKPVAYALAAGNSIILKPSEQTPHIASLMERIIEKADLPTGLVQIVQGGVKETSKLINCGKFDKIFYTGSPKVGKIVAEAAAKSLTPCILELGGKSPAFFTENLKKSHWDVALKRILFGTFANCGQLCVRPDYMVVHDTIYDMVVARMVTLMNEMYPLITSETELSYLINDAIYERTSTKLNLTKGTIISAKTDSSMEKVKTVVPTLVKNVEFNDPLMKEENFAPVLPILRYSDLNEVLDIIVANHDEPLAEYIFTDKKFEVNQVLARLRAGDCMVNDTVLHVGYTETPFGGIGNSGYGNYGGIYGYNAFTHERTVVTQPYWMDFLLAVRYPPYTEKKRKFASFATEKKPWFDRDGEEGLSLFVRGFIVLIFGVIFYYLRKNLSL